MENIRSDLRPVMNGTVSGESWKQGLTGKSKWEDIVRAATPMIEGESRREVAVPREAFCQGVA